MTRNGLQELNGEKNEAIRYAKAELSLVSKNCLLYVLQEYELQRKIEDRRDFERRLREKTETLVKDFKVKGAENAVRMKERQVIAKKIQKLDVRIQMLEKDEIPKCKMRDSNLRDAQKNYIAKSERFKEDMRDLEKRIEEVGRNGEIAEAKLPQIEKCLSELGLRKVGYEKLLREELEKLAPLSEGKIKEKIKIQERLDAPTKELGQIRSKIDMARARLEMIEKNEKENSEKLENFRDRYQEAEMTYCELKNDHDALVNTLSSIESSIQQSRTVANSLEDNLRDSKASNNEKLAKIDELQNFLGNNQSKNHILNFLRNEQKVGNIRGMIGRLGDLGSIPKKYDLAISNSVPALENIVFDTIQNATRAIDILGQKRIGHAVCLGLDKIRNFTPQLSAPFRPPNNAERLFDQITSSTPDARLAFYSVMKNLLVCPDITCASQVMRDHKTRVVTLQGDVVENNGVFTGGGQNKRKGLMSDQATFNTESHLTELKNLKRDQDGIREYISTVQDSLNDTRKGLLVANSEKNTIMNRIAGKKPALEVANRDLADLRGQEEGLGGIGMGLGMGIGDRPGLMLEISAEEKKMKRLGKVVEGL
jgi:structural maintenance of chromosome 4